MYVKPIKSFHVCSGNSATGSDIHSNESNVETTHFPEEAEWARKKQPQILSCVLAGNRTRDTPRAKLA